jgi:hypothetical protein
MTTFFQHAALSNECPKLIPVNDSEIRSLLSKICETYCQAYDHNQQPSPEWLDMTLGCAKGRPIRTYIRAGLEILDHYFLTGQIIEVPPANLIEHTMEEEKKLDNNEAQDI